MRGRLCRQTVLWGLRVRRCGGATCDRARLRALWRGGGKRAASFRFTSESGRIFRDAQTRRYNHGMSLSHGGHLTHGSPVNLSGKWFNIVPYGLNEAEDLDYEAAEQIARKRAPKLIIAGASAFSLRIDFERLARIAQSVGALLMVDMAHYAGLIAAGVYPNPVPHADFVTTTTHKSLRGPRGGVILMKSKYEKAINSAIFPGIQGGPLMHVIAANAVAFKEALTPEFKTYQQQVLDNARILAETLAKRGLRVFSDPPKTLWMLINRRPRKIIEKG